MIIPNLSIIGTHLTKTMAAAGVFSPANVPDTAKYLLVQAVTQNARYTLDGSAPTTTVGFQLRTTDEPLLIPLTGRIFPNFFPETNGTVLQYCFLG